MKENRIERESRGEVNRAGLLIEREGKIEKKNPLSAYIGSECLRIIREQEKNGHLPAALFTDIDNTFFRKDRAYSSRKLFEDLRKENYPVIAVTGNRFSGIEKRMQSGELPYFPIIASAVGTEIHILHEKDGEGVYKKDEAYEQMLFEKGYNRLELAKKGQQIIEDLGEKWKLNFQEPDKEQGFMKGKTEAETPFKLSFYGFAASETSLELLKIEVQKFFPGQCVVVCEEINYNSQMQEGDTNKKYCIDILPTTKGGVVEYIADKTGVAFKVIAGDSGNDAEMLMGGRGDVSIIVGGAKPELLEVVDRNILGNKINKDLEKIIDGDGKEKIYYREIGTGRGPESIAKVFKMLKNLQKIRNH